MQGRGLRVCVAGGVDGFWCVINQQHLPWHCLDSRLRAALLCCALLHLSTIHLFLPLSPSLWLPVYLSGSILFLSLSVFISPALRYSPSSLYLHGSFFFSPFCTLSFSLLISVAFVFNPFSSTLSLSVSPFQLPWSSIPPRVFFPVCCSLHPGCLVSGGWLLEPQSLIEMGSLW